ncbi:S1 family peptidase [Nocardia thraciensis]
MPVHADIEELLKGATAAVAPDRDGAERVGTAFRVAPGYAVTAAHVTDGVPNGRVRLSFGEGSECAAEVVAASPPPLEGGRWDFDDHAVLRLERPDLVTAPCVLMAEPALAPRDELLISALNPSYVERVVEIYHGYRVRDTHLPSRFFTIDGDRGVIRGMSGGPVWSSRHGGVVGFVKASENIGAAQGGAIAYLLEGLRRLRVPGLYEEIVLAHDAYHRDEQAWADRLVGPEAMVRRWLVEVHGWLSRIAIAAERGVSSGLVGELFRDTFPPAPARLLTLRDVAEYVGTESQNREFDLARFCALAPNHLPSDSAVAEGLRRIPKKIIPPRDYPEFERLFLAPRPASVAVTRLFGVILAEEGPRADERTPVPYRFEVARKFGDQEIIPLGQEGRYPGYGHAKDALKSALHRHLSNINAPRDAVEIVVALPDEHLTEEPLYEWLRPDERPFGSKFAMRLRRSCTWEKSDEQLVELEERWNRLRQRASDGLLWLRCDDPRAERLATLQELFAPDDAADGPHDALGVTEPPTTHVLTASATNALPVTLWRNERCPAHPGCGAECAGSAFRARLTRRLGGRSPVDWHDQIWRAQRAREESEERDRFWRKVVYIVDIPGQSRRRPPPLAGPA